MRALVTFAAMALLGAVPPAARPFKVHEKSQAADFTYEWPAEVSAVPALVKRFRADMQKRRAETIAGGKDEIAMRRKMGAEPIGYMHSTKVSTAGKSPRLLSLRIDVSQYTGGAHGMYYSKGLLWDRRGGREIPLASLFAPGVPYLTALRALYCRALGAERKRRRGGDGKLGGGISEFDACPKLSELAFLPADSDRDGRFDRLHFIAAPYTAGPYAEGDYDIAIPVTKTLLAMIRREYRSSFEAQPQ
jgi:hypothetical protein